MLLLLKHSDGLSSHLVISLIVCSVAAAQAISWTELPSRRQFDSMQYCCYPSNLMIWAPISSSNLSIRTWIWRLNFAQKSIFEVKTSLGALWKTFVDIELDWRVTRNARVHNARLHNVRSGKVASSHCNLDRRQLHEIETFDEIVMTKNFPNNWLHYQE